MHSDIGITYIRCKVCVHSPQTTKYSTSCRPTSNTNYADGGRPLSLLNCCIVVNWENRKRYRVMTGVIKNSVTPWRCRVTLCIFCDKWIGGFFYLSVLFIINCRLSQRKLQFFCKFGRNFGAGHFDSQESESTGRAMFGVGQ